MRPSPTYIDGATWVRTWREAGLRLDEIRAEELRHVDVAQFIRSMTGAFEAARANAELRPVSGLVEQQRVLHRMPR
jgi:hypothetical protein